MFLFPAIYIIDIFIKTSCWIVYKTGKGIYYLYKNHGYKLLKDKSKKNIEITTNPNNLIDDDQQKSQNIKSNNSNNNILDNYDINTLNNIDINNID